MRVSTIDPETVIGSKRHAADVLTLSRVKLNGKKVFGCRLADDVLGYVICFGGVEGEQGIPREDLGFRHVEIHGAVTFE